MVSVRLLSDLHIEFGRFPTNFNHKADVCLLAGDIGLARTAELLDLVINVAAQHERTILVPGNHEFYHCEMEDARYWMKTNLVKAVNDHGHHLEVFSPYGFMEYEGVPFVGGTFWTNLNGPDDESYDYLTWRLARQRMNDYREIKRENADGRIVNLDATDTWNENKLARAVVSEKLRQLNNPRTVIVTHHAPLVQCSEPVYRGGVLNGAYCNTRLENWFVDYEFAVWCHGHCHVSNRLEFNDRAVLSNTRGYLKYAENPDFDPDFIFEV